MKPKSARVISSERTVHVDYKSGEITQQTENKVVRLPQEPDYVKLYLHDIGRLLDLNQGESGLLMLLVRKIDYEGMITLSANARKRMAERLDLADSTFRNYMSQLVKKGILIRHGNNDFEANPHYFAKGRWEEIWERRQRLVMTVTYDERGRTVETKSEPNQQELPL